ncbi:MAG: PQQ-binding-like beta-propeller repeat protein [Polyangiales bacterium]
MRLKTLHCPRCGAEVELDRKHGEARCSYCGTRSYAENHKPEQTVVVKAHPSLWIAIALAVAGMFAAGAWFTGESVATAPPVVPAVVGAVETRVPVVEAPKPPKITIEIQDYTPARLVDSDGDGQDELLLPIERNEGGTRSDHFALYALPSGERLRETAAVAGPQSALIAVASRRLVLARRDGQLEAYDLASGDVQWNSALGERVAALCEGPRDTIHVTTDDARELEVDLLTGRQTPVRTPCKLPLAVSSGRHEPSDRRDYRAPHGMAAFTCGSVRVMGSQDYVVPDACRTHFKIDSDRLEGMVGHAIWAYSAGHLVFGVRTPGTYVPSVGLLERGKWKWKSEVPASNPLQADTGGPRQVQLHRHSLLIGYKASGQQYLTRFDADTGQRSWTQQLASAPVALLQRDDCVIVHMRGSVLTLMPSGDPIASISSLED